MKLKIALLGLFVMAYGCSPKVNVSLSNARKINDASKVSLFYSLPRTHLQFYIYAEKHTLVRGPYADWADNYLGVEQVIDTTEIIWKVTNVELNTYQDADPDELYAARVKGDAGQLTSLLSLSSQGLIADISPFSIINGYSNTGTFNYVETTPFFTDVSVKRNFYEEKDTLYKTLFVDTAFIKIPVIKSYLEKKTLEEKAQEAANYIIKIRKRRFKMISGQYTEVPEGKTLEISVAEMKKLEDEYLSLFIGKTIIEKTCYMIDYIPSECAGFKQEVLFRFSHGDGILPPTSKMGMPANLTIRTNVDPILDKVFIAIEEEAVNKGLIYRLPGQAEVSLHWDREEWFQGTVLISQCGYKVIMPASLLKK